MLQIQEINNKAKWEEFLRRKEVGFYPFFQSWNWGEVQKQLGFTILRFGVFESNALVGACLVVDISAKRGHFFHLRHGPVFLEYKKEAIDFLLDYLVKLGREKGISFVRMSPLIFKNSPESLLFTRFTNAPIHNMDGELSWVLPLNGSEDELLKQMRKTHRYLIRKALNMNIKITQSKRVSDLTMFLKLYSQVSLRRRFVPHRGLGEELKVFSNDNEALLFLAEYDNKIVGGALIDFVANMAIYHHGASDSAYKDIPVSYLIQWEAIREAKKRGLKLYNFWGIAPKEKLHHPWQGHTLFKRGFGGQEVEFIHAKDLPLNISYWKTYLIEYIRKVKKGY